MANVKISDKGRALLKRNYASRSVVQALAISGEAASRAGGLSVRVDGHTLTVRSAGQAERATEHRDR